MSFSFAIDRGGTFTDIFARLPNGSVRVLKLLSEDPSNYPDAPREGIRRIMEDFNEVPLDPYKPLDTSCIQSIRMGTTVATNALLERKGARTALVITRGFRDILHIGTQSRPDIFDLRISMPENLYEVVVEVDERVVLAKRQLNTGVTSGYGIKSEDEEPIVQPLSSKASSSLHVGKTGEEIVVRQSPDLIKLRKDLLAVHECGIRSVAVVLMHSYTFEDHERAVGNIAQELGFENVSLSCEVMPMVKIVSRGFTASADAYLTPAIKHYLAGFAAGFDSHLFERTSVLFMQSDGGLTNVDNFCGSGAILSGPAGGVVGYARTTPTESAASTIEEKDKHRGKTMAVIGFDMGGTSTDVSRFDGHYDHVFETTTAGVTLQAPQLDIHTVAAGGGSCLVFRSGLFTVGPESAGAHPGPVCYRKNGLLTVTDANLLLGRVQRKYFPHIFGPNEDQPLDYDATHEAFAALTLNVNRFLQEQMESGISVSCTSMLDEEVAMGFLNVANESMVRPIRALTTARGHDTADHVLACFGGAGGQHACAIARSLNMRQVFIHRHSGALSAYGMALADVVEEAQRPSACCFEPSVFPQLKRILKELDVQCIASLQRQLGPHIVTHSEAFLHMRFDRTDCALMIHVPQQNGADIGDIDIRLFKEAFMDRYHAEFGFIVEDRSIVVDDVRVRSVVPGAQIPTDSHNIVDTPRSDDTVSVYFESVGWIETPLFRIDKNKMDGFRISGPALLIDNNSTIVVEPDCIAAVTPSGDVTIDILVSTRSKCIDTPKTELEEKKNPLIGVELNAITLSLFSHRFMSIAEQMGRALQRTAVSTNIKERLDFSCALFGPTGHLVSNAPHIPVHLGAMQEAVRFQIKHFQKQGISLVRGDVLVSNHPMAGGSHLPDITVITPVFDDSHPTPVFFVANRGHHADIGGSTPGSMPPNSTSLEQEGACILSFKLVKDGEFQEAGITDLLMMASSVPGCSGTRNLSDNISDLLAQVAANKKGIKLVSQLIEQYGLDVVHAYMNYIKDNAEFAVRELLRGVAARQVTSGLLMDNNKEVELLGDDIMDDGTPIRLCVKIDRTTGSALFDFSGTGAEVYGNCNSPRAVTYSAVIYCLRCMVDRDIPLNQGCLAPIRFIIPDGCILNPSSTAAVVGGNVLTSQRVVDVVLKAFGVSAASQGCMNNLTFGDESVGYYETIAGGAGAGLGWHGRSGVHTHMTNTRITDPEILERRYPVILRRFSLRPHSRGKGKWQGGDGVVREIEFRRGLTVSLLCERRAIHPFGLFGGEDAKTGVNLLRRVTDGRVINIGAKCSADVKKGDILTIYTPGGGGFGAEKSKQEEYKTGR